MSSNSIDPFNSRAAQFLVAYHSEQDVQNQKLGSDGGLNRNDTLWHDVEVAGKGKVQVRFARWDDKGRAIYEARGAKSTVSILATSFKGAADRAGEMVRNGALQPKTAQAAFNPWEIKLPNGKTVGQVAKTLGDVPLPGVRMSANQLGQVAHDINKIVLGTDVFHGAPEREWIGTPKGQVVFGSATAEDGTELFGVSGSNGKVALLPGAREVDGRVQIQPGSAQARAQMLYKDGGYAAVRPFIENSVRGAKNSGGWMNGVTLFPKARPPAQPPVNSNANLSPGARALAVQPDTKKPVTSPQAKPSTLQTEKKRPGLLEQARDGLVSGTQDLARGVKNIVWGSARDIGHEAKDFALGSGLLPSDPITQEEARERFSERVQPGTAKKEGYELPQFYAGESVPAKAPAPTLGSTLDQIGAIVVGPSAVQAFKEKKYVQAVTSGLVNVAPMALTRGGKPSRITEPVPARIEPTTPLAPTETPPPVTTQRAESPKAPVKVTTSEDVMTRAHQPGRTPEQLDDAVRNRYNILQNDFKLTETPQSPANNIANFKRGGNTSSPEPVGAGARKGGSGGSTQPQQPVETAAAETVTRQRTEQRTRPLKITTQPVIETTPTEKPLQIKPEPELLPKPKPLPLQQPSLNPAPQPDAARKPITASQGVPNPQNRTPQSSSAAPPKPAWIDTPDLQRAFNIGRDLANNRSITNKTPVKGIYKSQGMLQAFLAGRLIDKNGFHIRTGQNADSDLRETISVEGSNKNGKPQVIRLGTGNKNTEFGISGTERGNAASNLQVSKLAENTLLARIGELERSPDAHDYAVKKMGPGEGNGYPNVEIGVEEYVNNQLSGNGKRGEFENSLSKVARTAADVKANIELLPSTPKKAWTNAQKAAAAATTIIGIPVVTVGLAGALSNYLNQQKQKSIFKLAEQAYNPRSLALLTHPLFFGTAEYQLWVKSNVPKNSVAEKYFKREGTNGLIKDLPSAELWRDAPDVAKKLELAATDFYENGTSVRTALSPNIKGSTEYADFLKTVPANLKFDNGGDDSTFGQLKPEFFGNRGRVAALTAVVIKVENNLRGETQQRLSSVFGTNVSEAAAALGNDVALTNIRGVGVSATADAFAIRMATWDLSGPRAAIGWTNDLLNPYFTQVQNELDARAGTDFSVLLPEENKLLPAAKDFAIIQNAINAQSNNLASPDREVQKVAYIALSGLYAKRSGLQSAAAKTYTDAINKRIANGIPVSAVLSSGRDTAIANSSTDNASSSNAANQIAPLERINEQDKTSNTGRTVNGQFNIAGRAEVRNVLAARVNAFEAGEQAALTLIKGAASVTRTSGTLNVPFIEGPVFKNGAFRISDGDARMAKSKLSYYLPLRGTAIAANDVDGFTTGLSQFIDLDSGKPKPLPGYLPNGQPFASRAEYEAARKELQELDNPQNHR